MSARRSKPLHRPEHLTENKLILLYTLAQMHGPLSLDQFTVLMTERGWMNYFDMCNLLLELETEGLIRHLRRDAMELYTITAPGLSLLLPLTGTIQPALRDHVDAYIAQNWPELMRQTDTVALARQNTPDDFTVTLKLLENSVPIFALEMYASSAHEAELLCRKFKKEGSELYARFIRDMTEDLYNKIIETKENP